MTPPDLFAVPSVVPVPQFSWNPFTWPASAAAGAVAEAATAGWQVAMTAIWGTGLWIMGFVFHLEDLFISPDLSGGDGGGGALRAILPFTLGFAVVLFQIIVVGQLIVAATRRSWASIGTALIGAVQFAAWVLGGLTYMGLIVTGVSGMTRATLDTLLNVSTFGEAFTTTSWPRDVADAVMATALALITLLLIWPAAIAHLMVMLTRTAALLILAATSPIAAAGLAGASTSRWFWMMVRWFHAAVFIPPVSALMLGLGVQLTNSVTQGAGPPEKAAGTALVGAITIAVSAVAPLALYRLLAFVEPGTTTGANVRAALNAYGSTSAGSAQGVGSGSSSGTGDTDSAGSPGGSGANNGLGSGLRGVSSALMGALDTAIVQGSDALNQAGVGTPQYNYPAPSSSSASAMPPRDNPSAPPRPPEGTSSGEPPVTTPPLPDIPSGLPPSGGSPATRPGGGAPSGGGPAAGAGEGVAEAAVLL